LPYLGGLDPALVLPRRVPPRILVPAGTVAIALEMSNIYPQATPGGWNILGRSPVPLFNPGWEAPSLLSPGDIVRHRAMPRAEYDALLAGFGDGSLLPHETCRA
jgi:inhibitor of KinA